MNAKTRRIHAKPKSASRSRSKPRPVSVCRAPRPGQRCPQCRQGRLDYDGLLNLSCPLCGHVAGAGGFT